jgi:hypothetical protein
MLFDAKYEAPGDEKSDEKPSGCSNKSFAGDDMIDNDVIRDDMTSGEAG